MRRLRGRAPPGSLSARPFGGVAAAFGPPSPDGFGALRAPHAGGIVTIVTQHRLCLFGRVADGEMMLNEWGRIVRDEWLKNAEMRPRVVLDECVVMPNHVHGIIILIDNNGRDTLRRGTLQRAPTIKCPPTIERFGKPTSDSIPTIVRLFKSATTRRINQRRGTRGIPVWQRNDYEHIIRNDKSMNRIRQYIAENPSRWHPDRENPGQYR